MSWKSDLSNLTPAPTQPFGIALCDGSGNTWSLTSNIDAFSSGGSEQSTNYYFKDVSDGTAGSISVTSVGSELVVSGTCTPRLVIPQFATIQNGGSLSEIVPNRYQIDYIASSSNPVINIASVTLMHSTLETSNVDLSLKLRSTFVTLSFLLELMSVYILLITSIEKNNGRSHHQQILNHK
jgi:hypothetical protein